MFSDTIDQETSPQLAVAAIGLAPVTAAPPVLETVPVTPKEEVAQISDELGAKLEEIYAESEAFCQQEWKRHSTQSEYALSSGIKLRVNPTTGLQLSLPGSHGGWTTLASGKKDLEPIHALEIANLLPDIANVAFAKLFTEKANQALKRIKTCRVKLAL